jgi:transcriptional regulator with XRE-family HTH domain
MDAAAMLRMARRRAQLSQRELARRAGVPQATISRIERGVVSPTFDTLDPLIRACGMQIVPVEQRGHGVDRSQIRERLALSPEERWRLAVDAANGVRRFQEAFGVRRSA